jgi:hypothetical protein
VGALAVAVAAGVFWLGQRRQDERTAGGTAEGIASIVALPSKVVAQASSDQFLTDAIPNTISAHLTQVKGLETKMPPSSVEVDRVQSGRSPPTSGSSVRSPSRVPSSMTRSRCSKRPTRGRSCRSSCGSH